MRTDRRLRYGAGAQFRKDAHNQPSVMAEETDAVTNKTGQRCYSGKGVTKKMRDDWKEEAITENATISRDVLGYRYFTTREGKKAEIRVALADAEALKEDVNNAVKRLEKDEWTEEQVKKFFLHIRHIIRQRENRSSLRRERAKGGIAAS